MIYPDLNDLRLSVPELWRRQSDWLANTSYSKGPHSAQDELQTKEEKITIHDDSPTLFA